MQKSTSHKVTEAAKALRAIPSKRREQASRENGKLGGRPPRFTPRELQTLLTALISLKAEQMRMARLERYDENDNPPALKRIEKAIKEIEEELK